MMTFGLLSFAQYSVTRDEPADRLSITLTLVLTAASYKFATTSMTPAISYITLLDRYVFFNSLIIVSNAIEGDWSTPHSLIFSPPSNPFLTLSPLHPYFVGNLQLRARQKDTFALVCIEADLNSTTTTLIGPTVNPK